MPSATNAIVLGSAEDIRAATLEDVADFFKIYYAPNNAVLTIVGDVDADDVKARVEKLFEHIPAQPPPPAPDLSEPAQTDERRLTLEDPFAPAARLYIAYKGPPGASADWDALHALIECGCKRQLVPAESKARPRIGRSDAGLCQLRPPGRSGPDHVRRRAFGRSRQNRRPHAVRRGPRGSSREGASAMSISRARSGASTSDARTRCSRRGSGRPRWATCESRFGDTAAINRRAARLDAITVDDVQRVAREYLKRERRTILEVVPAAAKAAPVQPRHVLGRERALGATESCAGVEGRACACRCRSRRTSRSTTAWPFKSFETGRVPLVTARFDIRGAGPLNDPPEHPGLALMTAVMLRNGTADRSSRDIAEQLDLLGVSTSAGTSGDPASIFFTVTGLSETFSPVVPAGRRAPHQAVVSG